MDYAFSESCLPSTSTVRELHVLLFQKLLLVVVVLSEELKQKDYPSLLSLQSVLHQGTSVVVF